MPRTSLSPLPSMRAPTSLRALGLRAGALPRLRRPASAFRPVVPVAAAATYSTIMPRPPASPQALARSGMVERHISSAISAKAAHTPADSIDTPEALVAFAEDVNLRTITLNRPKALNALNKDMVEALKPQLEKWENSKEAKLIVMKGTGRAFCSGGDVVSVVKLATDRDLAKKKEAVEFFKQEYELDAFIAKMTTPVVCILDGITMGGGLGLSVHAPFRVATERTRVAMPETTIGLFPDVGANFFLPRLDGEIGTYLGLTSENVYGWGAYQSGIATHYVHSSSLPDLEARLSEIASDATHDQINAAINEFAADASSAALESRPFELVGTKRKAIDRCFGHNSMIKIVKDLKDVESGKLFAGEGLEAWAKETRQTIEKRSPTSCVVTLTGVREGKKLNIDECFLMEMRLAATCCDVQVHPDFHTGVTHLLVNKRHTRADWKPATLEETKGVVDTFFGATPPPTTHVLPLNLASAGHKPYVRYPYARFGLPSEEEVKKVVIGEAKGSGSFALTKTEVLDALQKQRSGKVGVKEKAEEVLDRMTSEGSDGTLTWRH